jgi:hypothetical protein
MAEAEPPETPDRAVRAYIALYSLGAVLHGFDVMRPEGIRSAVTWWFAGGLLALFDWYWVKIKTWFGPRFAATANNVATDFRWWALALVIIFGSVAGADIYRAVTSTKDVPQTPLVISDPRPSDEIASIQGQLEAVTQERDAARQQNQALQSQLGSMGSFAQRLGVIDPWNATNLYWGGKELINRLRKHNAALLITAPPENEILGDYISSLINGASVILDSEHPEQKNAATYPLLVRRPSETDLDAPKLPSPDFNGVVIHGYGEIEDDVEGLLHGIRRCIIIKKTKHSIKGLSQYYKRDVIWIEVGKLPPWNNSPTCAS